MTRMLRRFFILLLVLIFFWLLKRHTEFFPSLALLFQPKPVRVDETPLRIQEIKNIAQLMTVEAYNEIVVDSTRYPFGISPRIFKSLPGNPNSFFGVSQLVLIVRGKVIAGVDLQAFDSSNIQVRNDSLFVQLPPAKVLDVITNPSGVETFLEKGDWNEAAATALKIKARNQMEQQAIAQGALVLADTKARQLVYELLKNTGYNFISVITAIQVSNGSGKQ